MRSLISLPNEIDRFFSDFGLDWKNSDSVWNPSVDLSETEDGYEIKAEIPGMNKKDIKISCRDNVLRLSGERKHEEDEKGKNYHRAERTYGAFQRSFRLPHEVKVEEINAKYRDGVLYVEIPKAEKAKPKEIAVS